MQEDKNCQWRVAARPEGNVKPGDFSYTEEPVPRPGEGEFLAKTLYLGLAPVMRMYMAGTARTGDKPLEIGDIIHGRGTALIIESNHPDYQVGEVVQGQLGWQTYKVSAATTQEKFFKCPDYDLPWSLCAGVLGMTGLSAWAGMIEIGKPQAGERVVVSGAATTRSITNTIMLPNVLPNCVRMAWIYTLTMSVEKFFQPVWIILPCMRALSCAVRYQNTLATFPSALKTTPAYAPPTPA